MPVEATDVDTPFEPQTADDQQDAQSPVELPVESPQSPKKKQGRPAGSKDKAPRRRPVRADCRPVTRRSAPRAERQNVCRSRVLLRLVYLLKKSNRPGLRGIASTSNIASTSKTCTERMSTGMLHYLTECWHSINHDSNCRSLWVRCACALCADARIRV